jgi:hypothetical protein
MTQVTLPKKNQTGSNEFADVQDNDEAIADVVNGELEDDNIAAGAGIAGSKLADSAISTAKLADSAISTAKLADSAVTDAKIANSDLLVKSQGVTSAKLAFGSASISVAEGSQESGYFDIETGLSEVIFARATPAVAFGYTIAFADRILEISGGRVRMQFVGNTAVPAAINISYRWFAIGS